MSSARRIHSTLVASTTARAPAPSRASSHSCSRPKAASVVCWSASSPARTPRSWSDDTTASASKCREAKVDLPDPDVPIRRTSAPAGTWIMFEILKDAGEKRAAGGGTDRCNRLELDLAGVLPRLRRVGGRRSVDMEQVLDPGHARHFQDGLLDARNLERVVHLAADGDHGGLDVDVDLTLRHVGVAEDLTLDPVPQREVVGRAGARSQAHHPLRKGGGSRAGPRSELIERAPTSTEPGARPIDELRPPGAPALWIEKVHGDRAGSGTGEDGQPRRSAAPGQTPSRRRGLLANLRVQRFLGRSAEFTSGISGAASQLLRRPAHSVHDVVAHLLQVNLLQIKHHASPPR